MQQRAHSFKTGLSKCKTLLCSHDSGHHRKSINYQNMNWRKEKNLEFVSTSFQDNHAALLLTSDLVGDVLLGGDDLVHVCSYGRFQRRARRLTLLHHRLILGLALALHQAVHCVADLHTQETHIWRLNRQWLTLAQFTLKKRGKKKANMRKDQLAASNNSWSVMSLCLN